MWSGPETCKLAFVVEGGFDKSAGAIIKGALARAAINADKVAFGPVDDDELVRRGVSFVVLGGEGALRRYRPDLHVRQCHGRPFLLEASRTSIDGRIGFPVFHPETFRRNLKWLPLLVSELETLRQVAANRDHWPRLSPATCVVCRGEFHRVDDHGVVYCSSHWPKPSTNPSGTL